MHIRTIHATTDNLTSEQRSTILSAFGYRLLSDMTIMLFIPAPVGFVKWDVFFAPHNEEAYYYNEAIQLLSSNNINRAS